MRLILLVAAVFTASLAASTANAQYGYSYGYGYNSGYGFNGGYNYNHWNNGYPSQNQFNYNTYNYNNYQIPQIKAFVPPAVRVGPDGRKRFYYKDPYYSKYSNTNKRRNSKAKAEQR